MWLPHCMQGLSHASDYMLWIPSFDVIVIFAVQANNQLILKVHNHPLLIQLFMKFLSQWCTSFMMHIIHDARHSWDVVGYQVTSHVYIMRQKYYLNILFNILLILNSSTIKCNVSISWSEQSLIINHSTKKLEYTVMTMTQLYLYISAIVDTFQWCVNYI